MSTPQPEKKPIAVTLVRKAERPEEPAGPNPPTEAGPDAPSAVPTATPPIAAPAKTAASERFTNWCTRPYVALPCVLASLALLSWCFLFRLPGRPMIVQARAQAAATPGNPISPDAVSTLQAQADAALRRALTNTDQLPGLVADLEHRAKASGFTVEAVTRPPVAPITPLPWLNLHPVALRLENNYERDEPAFHRLLDWLRMLPSSSVRIQVTALALHSLGDGVTTASVEFNIPSAQTNAIAHAQTASE